MADMRAEPAGTLKAGASRAWLFLKGFNNSTAYGREIATLWSDRLAQGGFVGGLWTQAAQ